MSGDGGAPENAGSRPDAYPAGVRARIERHLLVLMAARLALSLASLVIALGLDTLGGNVTVTEWHGFYGTVVAAFVATLVYQPFAGRVRRVGPFAVANIALDVALVSALVLFSGGSDSVFTFFYVLVPVYAAVLLPRSGAVTSVGLAGAAYAAVLLGERSGWLGFGLPPQPDGIYVMRWIVHTGAIVLVAALASFLVGELERAGRQLHQRTSDLTTLRALHQRTVESLVSGLLTVDRERRITSFNLEAERITDIPRIEALGRSIDEVLPGAAGLVGPERGDAPVRTRVPYEGRDGRERHLGVGSYVLRDAGGRAEGQVVIFQDVSDVVEMEAELRRSERLAAVGALAASIAHEIRNPLAAISGSIQMLQKDRDAEEGQSSRLMGIVVREVDRLNHLITDFLGYARPAPLSREPVDVASLFEEVLEIARSTLDDGIRLEQETAPGLRVHADPERLRQVLWNLVHNGVDAMPSGGVLRLEASVIREDAAQGSDSGDRMILEEKAFWAEIAVRDQGIGVEPGIATRIFDPFFTTKRSGSGLGLPTVHRIVEEHGGSVRMERGEGRWSTVVKIRLPMPGGAE